MKTYRDVECRVAQSEFSKLFNRPRCTLKSEADGPGGCEKLGGWAAHGPVDFPTAKVTSCRVCVEQYSRAPTSDWYKASKFWSMVCERLLDSASPTIFGSVSDAGVRIM
eukprot:6194137-Pleurochrysis_carterae.AAC.2